MQAHVTINAQDISVKILSVAISQFPVSGFTNQSPTPAPLRVLPKAFNFASFLYRFVQPIAQQLVQGKLL